MKNLTYESNRLWEEEISRQRLKNLLSRGYPVGEPNPEGNIAIRQPLMGLAWVPGQMRWIPAVASNYVNGMVICHQLPLGAPIQGQFGPSPGPFYPGVQPFTVGPSYPGPKSGSTYNPGTFGANSGQSLWSSIHASPDLSRRSIATTTTTTTTTTSTSFRGTLSTPTR